MPVFCKNCGKESETNANYCSACGFALSTQGTPGAATGFDYCEIHQRIIRTDHRWFWNDVNYCKIYAEAISARGKYIAAESDEFADHDSLNCVHYHDELVQKLLSDGWELDPSSTHLRFGSGARFRRRAGWVTSGRDNSRSIAELEAKIAEKQKDYRQHPSERLQKEIIDMGYEVCRLRERSRAK